VGTFTVYCRAYVTYDVDGTPYSVGPVTFLHTVSLVGVGSVDASFDGGSTWAAVAGTLTVPTGAQVSFRALPQGAGLFPIGNPVWSSSVPGGPTASTGETVSVTFGECSGAVETPFTVTAGCGPLSSATVSVLAVEPDGIEWRLSSEAPFQLLGPATSIPVGSEVEFRAVAAPAGASWPDGYPVWTGAAPDGGDPAAATAVFDAVSPSVDAPSEVTVSCGGDAAGGVIAVGVAGLQYRFSQNDDYAAPSDPLYVPVNTPVSFRAVISPSGADWPQAWPEWTAASPGAPGEAVFQASQASSGPDDTVTVTAACGSTAASAQVLVLDGLTILSDSRLVGVDGTVTLTAKRFDGTSLTDVACNWAFTQGGGTAVFVDGLCQNTPTVTLRGMALSSEPWDVVVQALDPQPEPPETATESFTVVGLALSARTGDDPFAPVTDTLYVGRGSTVEFQAAMLPEGVPWPDGEPQWTGAEPGDTQGTAEAMFSTASTTGDDLRTVTVTVTGGATASASVLVYDLGPIRYRLAEGDPWTAAGEMLCIPANRESFEMEVSIVPPGTPLPPGGIGWTSSTPQDGMPVTLTPVEGAPGRVTAVIGGTVPDSVDKYTTCTASCGSVSRMTAVGRITIAGFRYLIFGMTEWRAVPATGAASVPVGAPVAVQAVPMPSEAQFPPSTPYWTDLDSGAWFSGPEVSKSWPVISADCSDTRTLRAEFAGAVKTAEFVICGVEGLEYSDDGSTWDDVDGIIPAVPNQTIRFKANITPSCATWPGLPFTGWMFEALTDEVRPLWSVAESHSGQSHTLRRISAASQDTVSVSFSTATPPVGVNSTGWETVTANCGNAVSARVVVVSDCRLVPDWPSVPTGGNVTLRQMGNMLIVDRFWKITGGSGNGSLNVDDNSQASQATFTGDGPQAPSDHVNDVTVAIGDAPGGNPAIDTACLTVVRGERLTALLGEDRDLVWEGPLPSDGEPSPAPVAVAVARWTELLFDLDPDPGPEPGPDAPPGAVFVWPLGTPEWTVSRAQRLAIQQQGQSTLPVRFDTATTDTAATVAAECGNTLTFKAVVFDIESFKLTADGLITQPPAEGWRGDVPRLPETTLFTGPSEDGLITFSLECDLGGPTAAVEGIDPLSGADIGWQIVRADGMPWDCPDPTGPCGGFSAVAGDFSDGSTVTVTWNIGEADSAQLEVDFVVFLKREGIIGGGDEGMRRLVHCTIVKPDMIMHLPAEQDESEPPVTGWTDADNNGIRASSEEEEVDPGLYMAVNDDFDSGGEDPDCEDSVVAGTAEQIAADLRDMAKVTVSMPDWSRLPPDSSIVMSVDDTAPLRVFWKEPVDSDADGSAEYYILTPIIGNGSADTWRCQRWQLCTDDGDPVFYVEGAEPGSTGLHAGFAPPATPSSAPPDYCTTRTTDATGATEPVGKDKQKANTISVHLFIDSDNNNRYNEPDYSPEEEALKYSPDHPGKVIMLNVDDDDTNGYADNGALLTGQSSNPDALTVQGESDTMDMAFVRIVVSPATWDVGTVKVLLGIASPEEVGRIRIFRADGARDLLLGNGAAVEQQYILSPSDLTEEGRLDVRVEGVVKGSVRLAVAAFDVAGEHAVDADRAKLETTDSLESTPFNFTCVRQARDTAMLCPKCPLDGDHAWDCSHEEGTCNHCRDYCARAAIRMLNLFYGRLSEPAFTGVSQDRISLHCGSSFFGDLGHGKMLGMMVPQHYVPKDDAKEPALPWALGLSELEMEELLAVNPSEDILWRFYAGSVITCRPAIAVLVTNFPEGHSLVVCGARVSEGSRELRVVDPSSAAAGWQTIEALKLQKLGYGCTITNNRWQKVRISVIRIRDEQGVSRDGDEDGIVDTDESMLDCFDFPYRFPRVTLNPALPDSNGPLPPSNDKQAIKDAYWTGEQEEE
jgi:hypothetical protein